MSTVRRTAGSVLALILAAIIPACGGGGSGGGGAPPTGTAPGAFNLVTPADAATGLSLTPTLTWQNASGEVTYTLQIDTDTLFTAPLVYSTASLAVDTTSHPVPAATLSAGTTYFWRVSAVNASGTTTAADAPRSFTTAPAPGAFNLLTPADAATGVSLTPTLTWENASDEASYTVQIDSDSLFGAPLIYSATSLAADTTSHPVPAATLSGGTTYFWRVLALNAQGTTIAANAPRSFTTAAAPTPFNQARGSDYQVWAVAPAADGTTDVYVGGALRSYGTQAVSGVVRLNADGSRDSAFSMAAGGFRAGVVRALVPLASGEVVVGGEFTEYDGDTDVNGIVRLTATGAVDGTFLHGTGFNGDVNAIVLVPGSSDIIVGGEFTSYNGTANVNRLVRLNATGGIVTTFGTGFNGGGEYVQTISVATDGSGDVFVGGQFADLDGTAAGNVVRIKTSDNTIVTAFDPATNGVVYAVAQDAGGDVFIAGSFSSPRDRIVRVDANGTTVAFDASVTGSFNNTPLGLLASAGDVYVCGLFTHYNGVQVNRIVRLNGDGTRDAAFDTGTGADGGFNGDVNVLAAAGSGDLFAGGFFTACNGVGIDRLARLTATGTLTTLPTGAGFSNQVNAVAFVPSSTDVYVGGLFTHYDGTPRSRVARLNADGTLDATLSTGQGFVGGVNALAVAPDGKLYVGGGFTWYDGTSVMGLLRMNTDGTIDNSPGTGFVTGAGFNGTVMTLAMAPDGSGKIYAGGLFTAYGTPPTTVNRIVRLNTDGSVDATFDIGAAGEGFAKAVGTCIVQVIVPAADGSGDIYVGGQFDSYRGSPVSQNVVRLNDDGSVDAAFNAGTGFSDIVYAIAPTATDVYFAGAFGSYNGSAAGQANRLARVSATGVLDSTFATAINPGFNGVAYALALASGGDVYVGGSFDSFDGGGARALVRLNSDGTLDGGFPGSRPLTTYTPGAVYALAMLPDASGRLYMGGNITTWVGTTMDFFARLTAAGEVE